MIVQRNVYTIDFRQYFLIAICSITLLSGSNGSTEKRKRRRRYYRGKSIIVTPCRITRAARASCAAKRLTAAFFLLDTFSRNSMENISLSKTRECAAKINGLRLQLSRSSLLGLMRRINISWQIKIRYNAH